MLDHALIVLAATRPRRQLEQVKKEVESLKAYHYSRNARQPVSESTSRKPGAFVLANSLLSLE